MERRPGDEGGVVERDDLTPPPPPPWWLWLLSSCASRGMKASMGRGRLEESVSPCPSCPSSPRPQDQTKPSPDSAKQWAPRAATATTVVRARASTSRGVGCWKRSPWPSWPSSPFPKV